MLSKKLGLLGILAAATTIGAVGGSSLNAVQTKAVDAEVAVDKDQSQQKTDFDPAKGEPASPSQGGHVGANGKKEELLTGGTASKVTAAAKAAVPGGTIERVETDAEGAVYEAHMKKADGTRVTVKFDANFKVTGTEDGHSKMN